MKRLEVIRKSMQENKIDFLILSTTSNIRYFLDRYNPSYNCLVCIPLDHKPFVVTSTSSKSDFEKLGIEAFSVSEKLKADISAKSGIEAVKKILDNKRIRPNFSASEMSLLTYPKYQKFHKYFKKINDYTKALDSIRAIKANDEISRLKKAAQITADGMKAVKESISPSISERELARVFESRVRKKADWYSFETIIGSGPNSAEPHHVISDRKIKKSDFIVVDCGIIYKNYNSDMTRTFCLSPSEKQIKIHKIVLEAQQKAIDAIKPEIKASKIDLVARNHITVNGYGDKFIHGLGHGVGIDIHEFPSFKEDSEDVLKNNMVFTIEPGIYIRKFGGVRIEDMILLNKNKTNILTKFPRGL